MTRSSVAWRGIDQGGGAKQGIETKHTSFPRHCVPSHGRKVGAADPVLCQLLLQLRPLHVPVRHPAVLSAAQAGHRHLLRRQIRGMQTQEIQ
ncbi:hypothetical protein E2C01_060358 [Portunus trituberculatus]|uniref:Uncharacterized protein n=1 Tax=Portunus trituberculatus TaxID=210409 RepID=A0A5B7H510_PORTR|nr:hypothetical protein [Portunus trituberculatus]